MEKNRSVSCRQQLLSATREAICIMVPPLGTSTSSVESPSLHMRPAGRTLMPQQIRPDKSVSPSQPSLSPSSRIVSVASIFSDAHQHEDMVYGNEAGLERASSLRLAASVPGVSSFTRRYWDTVLGPSADIYFSDRKVPASPNLSVIAAPSRFSLAQQDLSPLDFFRARPRYTQRLDVSVTESSQVRQIIHLPALPQVLMKNETPFLPSTIPTFVPLVPRLDAEKLISCNQCDFSCSR